MQPWTWDLSIFISSRDFVTQSAPCVTKIQVYGVQDKQLCEKPKCYVILPNITALSVDLFIFCSLQLSERASDGLNRL